MCDVTARFAGPGEPAKVSYPRTEEEATKVILAALLEAPAVLDFDDMTADWKAFGAINRLLTSATMTDRILGVSKMATVSTDTLVLASGNNTGPTGDLLRRVLVIHLDTGDENPATLRYDGDPLGEIQRHRDAYVADVLLIVKAWIAAGQPRADLSPIATYGGRWTDFCRQPLVWLGLEDPAAGFIEELRADPDRAAFGAFLQAMHAQHGSQSVTLRRLLADADIALAEAIEDLPVSDGGPADRMRFGHYLRRHAGRPISGLKLEKGDSLERNSWRVVVVGPVAPTSPTSPSSSGPTDGEAN